MLYGVSHSASPVSQSRSMLTNTNIRSCEGEGEVRPITCHEGSEGEQRYTFTLSLTSALDRGRRHSPAP